MDRFWSQWSRFQVSRKVICVFDLFYWSARPKIATWRWASLTQGSNFSQMFDQILCDFLESISTIGFIFLVSTKSSIIVHSIVRSIDGSFAENLLLRLMTTLTAYYCIFVPFLCFESSIFSYEIHVALKFFFVYRDWFLQYSELTLRTCFSGCLLVTNF